MKKKLLEILQKINSKQVVVLREGVGLHIVNSENPCILFQFYVLFIIFFLSDKKFITCSLGWIEFELFFQIVMAL